MALSSEIVQKIKNLKIKTRRLLSGGLLGNNRSTQKGTGLDFDQIRAYSLGDDVRFIDWRASARADTLLVKQYMQETTKTVMLVCDMSASMHYGSSEYLKKEGVQEIGSVLALACAYENDAVGLVVCNEKEIKNLPPKQGVKYAHTIMETLFASETYGKAHLEKAIDACAKLCKQKSVVIIISDFFDTDYQKKIGALAKKHEVIAIVYHDLLEHSIPAFGFIQIKDPETGALGFLNTKDKNIPAFLKQELQSTIAMLKKNGVAVFVIDAQKSWIEHLISFFNTQNVRYVRGSY